jgi:predicted  nucleic acid-binding Zn-ribbon protein
MRTFKCYQCGHTWQPPHGEGGRGIDLTCPNCGCDNIHREHDRQNHSHRRRPIVCSLLERGAVAGAKAVAAAGLSLRYA